MLRTDFRDRGIPWMRLLLERRGRTAPSLNTGHGEQLRVALAGLATAALLAAILFRRPVLAAVALVTFGLLALMNRATYAWFAAERGAGFALQVVPLHLAYYVSNAGAAAVGIVQHLFARTRHREVAG